MRRNILLVLWLITDIAVFTGAYALAYFLRVGWVLSTVFPFDRFLLSVLLVSPVWLATLVFTRTFSLMRRQRDTRTLMYIAYAGLIGTSFFALSYYFLYREFFSRLLLVYALPLSILGPWLWHMAFGGLMRVFLRASPPAYPTLIVGATREAKSLLETMERNKSPLKPVGILDGRGTAEKEIAGVPVLGKLNKLEETLENLKITHLIQCSDLEQSLNLLSACRSRGIAYLLLPSLLGIVESDERMEALEGKPVTVVRPQEVLWKWFFN